VYRFNPPPTWPDPPPGWVPPPGWQPDPTWPAPPPGWTWWIPGDPGSAASTVTLDPGQEGGATAVDVPPRTASGADKIARLGQLPSRTRSWFLARPAWAKVLLVLLLIGLLPWLLIATGLTIIGIGLVGLRRGSLPAFRLPSRAAAVGAVVVGLLTLGAGSGLAASVLNSESPPSRTDPPIAAPASSSAAPRTRTSIPTPTPTPPAPTTTTPLAPGPTVTPTARKPTRTPAPAPTPRPRTPRPPPPLTVTILSLSPTGQGNVATATARTTSNANCSIVVDYKSGPSTARGLGPKTASAAGAVAWSWLVGTRTTPGTWPVTVTCSGGGQTDTTQRFLTVLDTGKPG
jgi:hypothetical protein